MFEMSRELLLALRAGYFDSRLCKISFTREVLKQDDVVSTVGTGYRDIPPTRLWFNRAHLKCV
jgi:hypothetical protein